MQDWHQSEVSKATNDVATFDIEGTTDTSVLKTKSLSDIYKKCRYSVEPTSYSKATMSHEWLNAMKTKLDAIEKKSYLGAY